jgi:hypothetical protein
VEIVFGLFILLRLLEAAHCDRKTMISRKFEWFYDLHGQSTTSMGVPYNELFSTEEIRRLSFIRFLASKNQELSLPNGEKEAQEQPCLAPDTPTFDAPIGSWLLLGVKLFWHTPLAMTTILTNFSPFPLHDRRFRDKP